MKLKRVPLTPTSLPQEYVSCLFTNTKTYGNFVGCYSEMHKDISVLDGDCNRIGSLPVDTSDLVYIEIHTIPR